MKRILPVMVFLMLTACSAKPAIPAVTLPTASGTMTFSAQTGTARTQSAVFLQTLWADFSQSIPFDVFGGTDNRPVWDAPGDVDLGEVAQLQERYLIPQGYRHRLHSGASVTHLMNPSVLTLVALQLEQPEEAKEFLRAWQRTVQDHVWPCDSPQRLLVASVQEQMVMAYGRSDVMEDLRKSLVKVYPAAQIQCYGSLQVP